MIDDTYEHYVSCKKRLDDLELKIYLAEEYLKQLLMGKKSELNRLRGATIKYQKELKEVLSFENIKEEV